MHLSQAASSRFVCAACRKTVVCSSGSRPNGLTSRISLRTTTTPITPSRCVFSTSVPLMKEGNHVSAEDPEFAFLDDSTKPPTASTNTQKISPVTAEPSIKTDLAAKLPPLSQDASVPWYLRHSSQRGHGQKPVDIPDLPPNPPPLLKTLLEYISITAGLDDLQLLDLRNIDPPPALGPKLIMIIATARSEKHLHVAADRFSRYMRREHGLRANAAGLLGRNELKIKLRRKAKRMKMLANVGGTVPEGNIDDGIRTGWICCTLSKIEAHPDDMHMPGDNVEEFVGFRDVKPGVNVVVQMFTKEKRAETDLETLWGGVLRTHQRQDQAIEDKLKLLEEVVEPENGVLQADEDERHPHQSISTSPTMNLSDSKSTFAPPPRNHRPQPTPGDIFPSVSSADTAKQLRRLHTVGLR